jgi:Mn2+/Fe2+ NRAMP family transporter
VNGNITAVALAAAHHPKHHHKKRSVPAELTSFFQQGTVSWTWLALGACLLALAGVYYWKAHQRADADDIRVTRWVAFWAGLAAACLVGAFSSFLNPLAARLGIFACLAIALILAFVWREEHRGNGTHPKRTPVVAFGCSLFLMLGALLIVQAVGHGGGVTQVTSHFGPAGG